MSHDPFAEQFQQQLFGLSPPWRMGGGLLACIAGVAWFVVQWNRDWYSGLGLFLAVLGTAAFLNGRGERLASQRIGAEVARATGEWEVLRAEIAAARRTGQTPEKLLQARGYREFAVRRWIVREIGSG